MENNVSIPDIIFNSYDELFNYYGVPKGESDMDFSVNNSIAKWFDYESYGVCTVHSNYDNRIFVFMIWITVQEDEKYNYGINSKNTKEDIENIFGIADYTNLISENIFEISYYIGIIEMGRLKFQFSNNILSSIILYCWD